MLESDSTGPWTVSTLKTYIEQMIRDRDTALKLAVTELDRRLENLNNAHAIAKDKERDFYSRAQHDDFAKDINRQFDQLRAEIELLRRPQWSVWFAAITLLMSMTGVLWYLAVQPIQTDLNHLKDTDAGYSKQMELTNSRIDRLYDLYRDIQRQHFETFDGKPPTLVIPPTHPYDPKRKSPP